MGTPPTKSAIPHPNLNAGSQWRRWDLHIHSPLSALNNQFPKKDGAPDWEAFIQRLESLKDVAAVGITDYFLIDGYKVVRKKKEEGRLANISLVLPNVEFRLDTFTGSRADASQKRLNVHVIFSDSVSAEDIEEHFLRELKFTYEGHSQSTDERWSITRSQLEDLGAKLKGQHAFPGTPFEVGCLNATVNLNEIKKALVDKPSRFKEKYLIVLADENLSDMSWDGQDHNTRKSLFRAADAIFSGIASTRAFALGQKHPSVQEFLAEFGALKPCVHGSDAHHLEKIGNPDKKRFCWIKADLTFDGLKQIVYEPAERVVIDEEPPNRKNDYQVIESIVVKDAPDWFSFREIPLNSDLVAVIGGRGSGKSALAELIAFGAGAETFKESKNVEDSFLSKASKKSATNHRPITGATVTLRWRSKEPATAVEVKEDLKHGQREEKVKYLPQKFVEMICAPENTDQLQAEIERVIFQRIPKIDRLGASSLRELRTIRSGAVQVKKQQLRSSIEKRNRGIFENFKKLDLKETKRAELEKSKAELDKLLLKPPEMPEIDAADQTEVSGLTFRQQALEDSIARLNQQLSTLDTIEARVSSFGEEIRLFNDEIAKLLPAVTLESRKADFEVLAPSAFKAILDLRRNEVTNRVTELTEAGDDSLDGVKLQITSLTEKFHITDAKRFEYESFEKQKQSLNDAVSALENDLKQLDEVTEPALKEERKKRLDLYLDYFELLKEEKASLDKLYEPLHAALQKGTDTDKKLEFVSKITFDSASHAKKAFEIIDSRRRTRYRDQEELGQAIKLFISKIENVAFEREQSRTEVAAFRESFLKDTEGQSIKIGDQLRRDRTEEDFNNWFYDIQPFLVKYSMRFDNKELSLLSPGQKGIVLLLVYLEVDQDDRRPLIIDQPEDNLDNLSIYDNLVQYFRKRKKTRQIIIITHNPNLVVNTDAEQVIVADFDGSRNPRIVYTGGSLEHATRDIKNPGIREQVCSILEGGSEAFQKREQKYSLPRTSAIVS